MAEGKTAIVARCGNSACNHEWAIAYVPMKLEHAAELMKAKCPMCASYNGMENRTPVYLAQ